MSTINNMKNCYQAADSKEPLWNVDKIEQWFKTKELPQEIRFDEITTIRNVPKMIERHLGYLKANPTKYIYSPYYGRLLKLAKLLTT